MPPLNGGDRIRVYVGVDPGMSGGIAFINGGGVVVRPTPATEADLWDLISCHARSFSGDLHAVVELVTGYVGGAGNTGSSQFKFGRSCGLVEMALVAASVPYEKVTPRVWQKALGVPQRKKHTRTEEYVVSRGRNKGKKATRKVGGETDREWKGRLRGFAQRLFPGVEMTVECADALLIAEFCRRKCEGRL